MLPQHASKLMITQHKNNHAVLHIVHIPTFIYRERLARQGVGRAASCLVLGRCRRLDITSRRRQAP